MIPGNATTIVDVLLARADLTPQSLAFAMGSDQLSYGRLGADVHHWASALTALGLGPGHRLALLAPTGLDFIRGLFAAQAVGAAVLPLHPDAPIESVVDRLRVLGCDGLLAPQARLASASKPDANVRAIALESLTAALPSAPPLERRPAPDDPALLLSTSGTSGEPRTAVILHRNLMASARASHARLQIQPQDVLVNWAPLYHGLGLVRSVIGGLVFGCPVHLVPPAIGHLRTWLTTIAQVRGTITVAPDFGYRAAVELVAAEGLDVRSLRYAINSGEPIRPATIESFERKFGVPGVIRPGYGLSEANGVTYFAPGELLRQDATGNVACGRAATGLALEIVDDQDRPRPPGASGEIRVRGEQVFAGYLNDEQATREKLRDGWLYTGDIGCLDQDGYLYVLGRTRSLIKRGGAMIVPGMVEQAAERVPRVVRAAALGVERGSRLGGEELVVVAEIEPAPESGADVAQLVRAIGDAVAHTIGAAPAEVILVRTQSLPRTANGKVRHLELKRLLVTGELKQQGIVIGDECSGC